MPDTDVTRHLEDRTLILLSNREPYEHAAGPSGVEVKQPAGGLVSALDPTMQRTHGVWVAWGSGSGDREAADEHGRVQVPPGDPTYALRRVWLDDDDIEGYYLGFANSALWPLCHMLIQHFRFRADHWTRYQNVNERFADAVAGEVLAAEAEGRRPMVWVQDYHFALVPALLRLSMPRAFIHQFWHIPFPPTDILQLLPADVYAGVLRGLLGNDLLEFHTERYAQNFLTCVAESLPDATVDAERMRVTLGDHVTTVGAFPISIDVEQYEGLALAPAAQARAAELRTRYATGDRRLGVSVDRIDYTKGIPERLRALELLWEESPELRGRFTMIVVATPSRSDIPAYDELEHAVVDGVAEINARYASDGWEPIVLLKENVDAELLASIYRAADLCLVSSLQDGMNLVAKEFVACQVEERGVLVLSRFTGAAEEIEGAVLINPFNVDGFAAGIRRALEMPLDERRQRMRGMRDRLRRATIFDWLDSILSRASALMAARPEPEPRPEARPEARPPARPPADADAHPQEAR